MGAGPGGSAAAWALASQGHDVLLIDRSEFPRDKTCGDGLTPMALAHLRNMGVLAEIEAADPARIDTVRLIGPFGQTITLPLSMLETEYPYALVLPRFTLDDILRQHAIGAGAEFLGNTRVEHLIRQRDKIIQIECISDGHAVVLQPRQVILAPGANMGLLAREKLIPSKLPTVRAARAYYESVEIPTNRFDFYLDVRLMPGYGWIFPIGGGAANVGVGTMPSFWASKRPATSLLKEFVARRSEEGIMRHSTLSGAIKGFPLRVDFPAHRIAGENWLIVGEATGLVNPVTGEGIDLALESGLLAGEVMHNMLSNPARTLIAYQREIWERFGPLYDGMRALRDIIVTPFFADYVFWLMSQHDFLSRVTFKITQGLQAPQDVFHPLFILQFFSPLSPRWVAGQIKQVLTSSGVSTRPS